MRQSAKKKEVKQLTPDRKRRVYFVWKVGSFVLELIPSPYGFRVVARPDGECKRANWVINWNCGHKTTDVNKLLQHAAQALTSLPPEAIQRFDNIQPYYQIFDMIGFLNEDCAVTDRVECLELDDMQLQFALEYQKGQLQMMIVAA